MEQPQTPFSYPVPTKPVADWNNEKANSDKCCKTEMNEQQYVSYQSLHLWFHL